MKENTFHHKPEKACIFNYVVRKWILDHILNGKFIYGMWTNFNISTNVLLFFVLDVLTNLVERIEIISCGKYENGKLCHQCRKYQSTKIKWKEFDILKYIRNFIAIEDQNDNWTIINEVQSICLKIVLSNPYFER